MNTTFYLTDNLPKKGRLRFLSDFFPNQSRLISAHTLIIQTTELTHFRLGAILRRTLICTLWLEMLWCFTVIFHTKGLKPVETIPSNIVLTSSFTISKVPCFPAYVSSAIRNLLSISWLTLEHFLFSLHNFLHLETKT